MLQLSHKLLQADTLGDKKNHTLLLNKTFYKQNEFLNACFLRAYSNNQFKISKLYLTITRYALLSL
jgi:hypothetical protein